MTTIHVKTYDQILSATQLPRVASGNQNTVRIHVDFDSAWDGYAKSVIFRSSKNPTLYEKVLSTDGNCLIPPEVLVEESYIFISIEGVNGALVKASEEIRYKISAGTPSIVISDPTDDVYHQILNEYGNVGNEIAVERARIDKIIALEDGSTTGDAELQDIRVGADGNTYGSAGTAVREQFSAVTKALTLSGVFTDVKYTIESGDGDEKATIAGLIDLNGEKQGTSSFYCTDFIELHHSVIEINLIGYTNLCSVAYYDETKTFISGLVGGSTYEIQKGKQTIPTNAKYVRFTFLATNSELYAKMRNYPTENRINELEAQAEKLTVKDVRDYTLIQSTAAANGYIDVNGNVAGTMSWYASDFVRITKAARIDYSLRATTDISILAYYDKDKRFLNGVIGESVGLHEAIGAIPPDEAVYVRFSAQIDYTNQYIAIYYPITENNAYEIQRFTEASPLYGKKMVATGDSITATTINRPFASYAKMIATSNNMDYKSYAIWGATLPSITQSSGSILATIGEMSVDADYVILSGGANDWYYLSNGSETLGEITNGYTDTLDETTFYGALETVCKTAIEKWAGKKIIYVITHRLLDVGTERMVYIDEYVNGMISIFKKWGIPYVDLYHGMPSLFLPPLKDVYTTKGDATYNGSGDGLHPNDDGYRKYYVPKVEALLKSI